jgi:hypothetical protein
MATRNDTYEINKLIMYEYRIYGMDICLHWPRRNG